MIASLVISTLTALAISFVAAIGIGKALGLLAFLFSMLLLLHSFWGLFVVILLLNRPEFRRIHEDWDR